MTGIHFARLKSENDEPPRKAAPANVSINVNEKDEKDFSSQPPSGILPTIFGDLTNGIGKSHTELLQGIEKMFSDWKSNTVLVFLAYLLLAQLFVALPRHLSILLLMKFNHVYIATEFVKYQRQPWFYHLGFFICAGISVLPACSTLAEVIGFTPLLAFYDSSPSLLDVLAVLATLDTAHGLIFLCIKLLIRMLPFDWIARGVLYQQTEKFSLLMRASVLPLVPWGRFYYEKLFGYQQEYRLNIIQACMMFVYVTLKLVEGIALSYWLLRTVTSPFSVESFGGKVADAGARARANCQSCKAEKKQLCEFACGHSFCAECVHFGVMEERKCGECEAVISNTADMDRQYALGQTCLGVRLL